MAYKKGRCLKRRNGRCVKRAKHRRRPAGKRASYRRGRRSSRKAPGMARRGSHCRRMGSVYSRKLRKRVKRCVGGYARRSRR